ncbi:MAG: hypothetical protein U0984_15305, partial [Prosthecobacter sp.]|nr:hypothetical protein [Prosthecobacter sp.]
MNVDTLGRPPVTDPDQEETHRMPFLNRQNFAIDETDAEAVCAVLEDLIEITRDGEEGYSHAAQYATDRALRDE